MKNIMNPQQFPAGLRCPAEAEYFDLDGTIRQAQLEFHRKNGEILCTDPAAGISFKIFYTISEAAMTAVQPASARREEAGRKLRTITLFPGFCSGQEGDGGALFLPLDSGRLCHTEGKAPEEVWYPHFREPDGPQTAWSNMSIIGAFAGGTARSLIMEEGRFDAQIRIRTNWGESHRYELDGVFFLRDFADEELSGEDLSVELFTGEGDYRILAEHYREFVIARHGIPSLADKAERSPDLDYSARALTVRCRMGVKPLPCQITEQTPETEPPVKVFMHFSDIRRLAEEFHRQGIEKAEFNLVGWGHGGHDGAFPQLFPPEEAFGGEAELRKTIDFVKKSGYHISLHDNYFDGYTLARNFALSDAVVKHDGRLCHTSCGVLAGGRPYRVCARQAAEKYAVENFPACAALGIQGAYFVDVLSIIGMVKCYHGKHPLSRAGNAKYYKRIMRMQQEFFQVSMSEGARDWALPELDRAYMVLNCIHIPDRCVDELVPFFELVYHDRLLFNNFREGINSFPGDRLYLQNLAWGGYPIIYFHHLFHPNWSAADGWALDLTLGNDEKLKKDVAKIRKMELDLQRLAPLRYERISAIEELPGDWIRTTYGNGRIMWSNFADHPQTLPTGESVPAMEFIVAGK